MPIYEYVCSACEHEFEQIQKFSDAPITRCPSCAKKGKITKKLSTSAFILNGGGWYKQGYSGPSGGNGKENVAAESKSGASSATKSESKSDSSGSPESSGSSESSKSSGGETKVEAAGHGSGCGHCAA